jgi:hypothetical protein
MHPFAETDLEDSVVGVICVRMQRSKTDLPELHNLYNERQTWQRRTKGLTE